MLPDKDIFLIPKVIHSESIRSTKTQNSMTKNPFLNAIAATIYIVIVAAIMFYGPQIAKPTQSIIVPIGVLSLFSLSAAVMAYIFGYQPVLLFLDNKKKQAVDLFLKTVGVFAGITFLILVLLFSGIVS